MLKGHLFVLHNSPLKPTAMLLGLALVAWSRRARIAAFRTAVPAETLKQHIHV